MRTIPDAFSDPTLLGYHAREPVCTMTWGVICAFLPLLVAYWAVLTMFIAARISARCGRRLLKVPG